MFAGLGLLLSGCNIRYISPDTAQDQYADSSTAAAESAETDGDARPWYQGLLPGFEDAGTTTPDDHGKEVKPAVTATPPQATASTHLETAAQIHAREHPVSADDPMRSVEHRWSMQRGVTLEEGLREWTDKVGLQLRWDVPRVFRIEAPIIINGTFEYAFSRVMEAYALAEKPVLFDYGLYSNQVLRITLKGELAP